ncbi:MAG: hypothetical protein K6E56_00210, partial [Lachnospiraceae bacterium]|nr:hypothetical protein [Lachnospiraceae bacterium]
TTLATNACVEDKGARAGLILVGAYKDVVTQRAYDYGLPPVPEICLVEGLPGEELDIYGKDFEDELIKKFSDMESIAIAQRHPDKDGGAQEKEVAARVKEVLKKPCILSSELFTELDILKRGSGALLNARLIPLMTEFIDAVKAVAKELSIPGKIWIVRSDGTLMSEDFSRSHPVETLLCGPAASVISGRNVENCPDALIVDMGGTTTDISVVRDGRPLPASNGITVGRYKTLVNGVYIKTFGLGGDSRVYIDKKGVHTDVRRVVPLCELASEYPEIISYLKELEAEDAYALPIHEFFVLVKDPGKNSKYDEKELAAITALKNGPLSMRQLSKAIKIHVDSLPVKRLENEGVILRSGLTPTDVMHIKGRFDKFDKNASVSGAKWLSKCAGLSVDELCEEIDKAMTEKLYSGIVEILIETDDSIPKELKKEAVLEELIKTLYADTQNEEKTGLKFFTKSALIGIGAPTKYYIERVAKLLNAEPVIPVFAPTANAFGAAVSNISFDLKLEIGRENERLVLKGEGITPMFFEEKTHEESLEKAIKAGKEVAYELAKEVAAKRGALGNLKIDIEDKTIKTKIELNHMIYDAFFKHEIIAHVAVEMKL